MSNNIGMGYDVPEGYDRRRNGVVYPAVDYRLYESTVTGRKRAAVVITPPDYDPDQKYPVAFLLHGIGGDEREWLIGNPQIIYGNLLADGKVKEMILVLPNIRTRENDSANTPDIFTLEHCKSFDNFIHDLDDCLLPFIQKEYSIREGRENLAVCGLSMGGRESLYIGLTEPETFGYIGAFEPAPGVLTSICQKPETTGNNSIPATSDPGDILTTFKTNDTETTKSSANADSADHPDEGNSGGEIFRGGVPNRGVKGDDGLFTEEEFTLPADYLDKTLIMIVKGNQDEVVGCNPRIYHETFERNHVPHIYYETEGGHEFRVWENGLYHFLQRIF